MFSYASHSHVQYFLDDIIVAADNIEEMLLWLQKVFNKLAEFNLTLDPAKAQLCKENIKYLRFNINSEGYSPSEDNIEKIKKFPIPTNLKQVKSY